VLRNSERSAFPEQGFTEDLFLWRERATENGFARTLSRAATTDARSNAGLQGCLRARGFQLNHSKGASTMSYARRSARRLDVSRGNRKSRGEKVTCDHGAPRALPASSLLSSLLHQRSSRWPDGKPAQETGAIAQSLATVFHHLMASMEFRFRLHCIARFCNHD